jgi:hypothetical protein
MGHEDRPWSFEVNFLDEGSSNGPRSYPRNLKTKSLMKTLFLAVLSLVLIQPVRALEPGRYLISCKYEGGGVYRGYLLTIGKDGKQSLEAATSDTRRDSTTRADSVTLTKDKEDDDSFILQAKFTAEDRNVPQGEGKVTSISTTCVLALSFSDCGRVGSGSELRVGKHAVNLTATIGRLPDPEPAK